MRALLIFAITAACAACARPAPVAPPSSTLSAVTAAPAAQAPPAAQRVPEVDAIFAAYDRPDSPGCAVGVYKEGALAYARGYGQADLEHGVAIAPDTVFDIGSATKQFTAASIALLVADGKLAYGDDVRRYVPELPDYGHTITLAHLLHHTSGLRDYYQMLLLAGFAEEDLVSREQALRLITRQRAVNFAPGDEYLYSNSNYVLLGEIVARTSGMTLASFQKARIFDPLGMTQTHLHDDHRRLVPRRAAPYVPGDHAGFGLAPTCWEPVGDGGVMTTVLDLARWNENFYTPTVGGAAMLEALRTRGTLTGGERVGYAEGLQLDERRGLRRERHGGGSPGYSAQLTRYPDQLFAVSVLCNVATAEPDALADAVSDVYLARAYTAAGSSPPANATAAALSPSQLADLAGSYRNARGDVSSVEAKNGANVLHTPLGDLTLEPIDARHFRLAGLPDRTATFAPATGRGRTLLLAKGGKTYESFEAFTPWTPGAKELAVLAGSYVSDECEATIELRVAPNGKLHLWSRGRDLLELRPTFRDGMTDDPEFPLVFERDARGAVAALRLSASRARELRFVRIAQRTR